MDGIIDSTDISLSKFWVIVKDREAWCATVHGVTKSWIRLSNQTTGDIFRGEEGTDTRWGETRDAAKHPFTHRTVTTKNDLVENVDNADVKASSRDTR